MTGMARCKRLKDSDLKALDARTRNGGRDVRTTTACRIGLTLLITGSTIFCVSLFYVQDLMSTVLGDPSGFKYNFAPPVIPDHETLKRCSSALPPPATPPVPVNLWASLDISDTLGVLEWLGSPELDLNLTRGNKAAMSDNHVFLIEAYRPPKAVALAYLASPSLSLLPDRFARVTIHHGAQQEPEVKDYLVGPLPIGNHTKLEQLKEIYHRNDIPYNARGVSVEIELPRLLGSIMLPLAGAMQALFGGVAIGLANDTLVAGVSAPWSFDGTFRRVWISWKRNIGGSTLHPLDFYLYTDITGTDPSQWEVLKLVYNYQVFDSTTSFLEAFHNGTLERPSDPRTHDDLSWSTRKRVGPQRDLDHLPGPRSVSFAGLRFRVDRDLQYISWMGWGLYLGFDRDMGLSLWDIRFKDERIIYQLAPQEAIAHYAGNNPIQSTTAWLDRYFGMGAAVRDMLPGYDCPQEAIYFPATIYSSRGSVTSERAVCIFEQDTGRPLTRHTGYSKGEFGAVKGYVLTIRSISTVGNYDYIFDYLFSLDGTVEVRFSASGYLQAAYYEAKQDFYGTRIRSTTMGSLHDHVVNFKVDLDIAGVENSLLYTSMKQEETTQPWFDDDWGQTVIQQVVTREYITNEDDALLKFPANFQGWYALVNREQTNRWGSPRGYAIHHGFNPIHNTVVGSKRLLNNANWARYNLAVSRRKDKEPSSSSMWNLHLPGAPMVDFHKFFDGENITQEDLVAWVNVGMHHLPQAEDAPNTRTTTATSSFFLTPLNYFDSDTSIESSNAILLNMPEFPGAPYTYDDYGVRQDYTCIPEAPPPFEYTGLRAFDLDGKPEPPTSIHETRKTAEMYHHIMVKL